MFYYCFVLSEENNDDDEGYTYSAASFSSCRYLRLRAFSLFYCADFIKWFSKSDFVVNKVTVFFFWCAAFVIVFVVNCCFIHKREKTSKLFDFIFSLADRCKGWCVLDSRSTLYDILPEIQLFWITVIHFSFIVLFFIKYFKSEERRRNTKSRKNKIFYLKRKMR